MNTNKIKIIAFVGLAGAGKTTSVEYIAEKGYPKVYFGGVILNALEKSGLTRNPENEKKIREEIRKSEGADVVAKKMIEQIDSLINSGQHRIVADGLYSWTEYKVLKHYYPSELELIAVVAPKKLRHHRLINRPIRPMSQSESDQRDWAEIENIEKGGPIAIADHFIINDGSMEHLYEQIDKLLSEIDFVI